LSLFSNIQKGDIDANSEQLVWHARNLIMPVANDMIPREYVLMCVI